MSSNRWYNLGIAESNGDVISVCRPSVAETTSGLLLEQQQILNSSQTVRGGGDYLTCRTLLTNRGLIAAIAISVYC
jgi:hypothetical protein